jgi:hypothetical protein
MQLEDLRVSAARSRLLALWLCLASAACEVAPLEDSAASAETEDAGTEGAATRDEVPGSAMDPSVERPDSAVEPVRDATLHDADASSGELDPRFRDPTPSDGGSLDADANPPSPIVDSGATSSLDASPDAMTVVHESDAASTECGSDAACSMCSASVCGDPGTLLACHDGRVERVACSASQTCLGDSTGLRCGGVCRLGKRRCSTSGNPQVCDGTGTWQGDPNKPTCSSQELCEKWSSEESDVFGTCVTNELRARGYLSNQGTVLEPEFGDFIAVPVRLEDDYRLARMGALTVDGATSAEPNRGGQSLMFVFADVVVEGKHRPGQILTYGLAKDLLQGGNVWSPINTGVVFAAGPLYWIAIDINGAPGDQTRLYRLPAQANSDGLGVVEWAKKVPATVPDRFPLESSVREENAAVSLYLHVQRYWH